MWTKCGKIDDGHAQIPVVKALENNLFRIFVTDRTSENKSYIRRFDFDISTRSIFNRSTFASGATDEDQDGMMTSCLIEDKFYYTAWRKLDGKKYAQSIGVMTTDLNKPGPRTIVIQSSNEDEMLCCSPFVVKDGIYKMWFISGRSCGGWSAYGPRYTIRYAESHDGLSWDQREVNFARATDEVFARPYVIKECGLWKMWYSYLFLTDRKAYRIGYAESVDGISWTRIDNQAGIGISDEGWDSETVAFPFLINHRNMQYMFYSGNRFGMGGLGYACRKICN